MANRRPQPQPPAGMEIRRLAPADAEAFVTLRRRALLEEPLAFSASPEDDRASDLDAVRTWVKAGDRTAIFGAFASAPAAGAPTAAAPAAAAPTAGAALVGAVGVYQNEPRKASHKAQIWGMYVAPEHRGTGAGRRLLQAAIDHTQTLAGVSLVQLSVSDACPIARRLYESLGFSRWGSEEAALCHEGRVVVEHHMVLHL